MSVKQNFGMSESVKAELIAQMQGLTKPSQPLRVYEQAISKDLVQFETLPIYTQLKVEKAVVERLGLDEIYYVCHDQLSQDTAVINGRTYLNFSCYDYLGLNGDPRIGAAINEAFSKYGSSASASRLTAGERPPHRALEQALAKIYDAEDCLCFVSGHATNVSTLECLFGPQDVIFLDVRSHNSLMLGAKAANSARYVFPNNDMQALKDLLIQHRKSFKRALIVTEGLFGMDGCICNLPTLVELKKEFGCFLMVDEAHSMGVLGQHGFGVSEHFHLDTHDIDIFMGTLSKTFCGCGGYIAGKAALIEILKYFAPGYVYSVGMPPMLAAASLTALQIMQSEPERVAKLQENSQYMLKTAKSLGLDTGKADGYAVIPVMMHDSLSCVIAADMLRKAQVFVLPIIYPGVEEGMARLRFFVSQTHSFAQIKQALELTKSIVVKAKERAAEFSGTAS